MTTNPKVSILIPVYKAQNYIEKCLRSVFEQTYDNIEYVIVDDASPDDSISIAKRVAKEHGCEDSMIIIKNETNKGVAYTRNVLLDHSSGDYIYFVDSDDYIENNAIEIFVATAIRDKADIVRCNYFEHRKERIATINRHVNNKNENHLSQCLTNISEMHSLWLIFIRKEIISKYCLHFAEDINGLEDFLMTVKLFYYAKKISDIADPLYHYRLDNNCSITHQVNYFNTNRIKAIEELILFLKEKKIFYKYEQEVLRLEFISKQSFLLNKKTRDIKKYICTFPESSKCYNQFSYNIKYKILFYLAKNKHIGLLKLTYRIHDIIEILFRKQ